MAAQHGRRWWSGPLLGALACLATAAGLSGAPAGPRAVLASLRFTSDHQLLCQNTSDPLTGGPRYPAVAWSRTPATNAPITHTSGATTHIQAVVEVLLDDSVPKGPFVLAGVSPEPALCFHQTGTIGDDRVLHIPVAGHQPPGRRARTIHLPVRWTLTTRPGTANEQRVDLGSTGPHTVYLTLGRPRVADDDPRTLVTDIRMQTAIERIAAAQDQVGDAAAPPWLMYELMRQAGTAYVPARHYPRALAWKVPESWRMAPPGASCLSIVEFVALVANMAGIDGDVRLGAFYARPDEPARAVRGGLGDPPVRKQGPGNEPWQLFLTDDNNTRKGQLGGAGGMNFYEAALEFTWQGKTYYYPAGTDRVYDSPDMVIRVFRTLAWAAFDYQQDAWVVREVVHTYTPPGRKQPESVPLPR